MCDFSFPQLGGGVLSRDQDFFRYHSGCFTGIPPYLVYFDFTIYSGSLALDRHGGPSRHKTRSDIPHIYIHVTVYKELP